MFDFNTMPQEHPVGVRVWDWLLHVMYFLGQLSQIIRKVLLSLFISDLLLRWRRWQIIQRLKIRYYV